MNRLIFASNGLDIRAFDDEGDSTIIVKNTQSSLQPSPQPESLFDIMDIQWLRTTPNAEVRFTPNNSQDSIIINANSEGLINLDEIPNGVYQVSVNNSQPQPLLKAIEISYEVFYILYYNEREYFIQANPLSIHKNTFRIYTIDPVTNEEELYWEFYFDNYDDQITLTYSEDESVSPGLLPEGTYKFIVDDDINNSWKIVDLINSEYEIQVNVNDYYNPYHYNDIMFYTLPGSELQIQGPDGYDKTILVSDYFYNMSWDVDGVGPPPGESSASLTRDGTVLAETTFTLEVVPMPGPPVYIRDYTTSGYTVAVEAPDNTMAELGQGDMVIERKWSGGYPFYAEFYGISPNIEYWARYTYDIETYTYPSKKSFITIS